MPQQYLPQDLIDEAKEAHRQGVPLGSLASKLGLDPEELARLMGLPAWKSIPQTPSDGRLDLWAAEDQL